MFTSTTNMLSGLTEAGDETLKIESANAQFGTSKKREATTIVADSINFTLIPLESWLHLKIGPVMQEKSRNNRQHIVVLLHSMSSSIQSTKTHKTPRLFKLQHLRCLR